MRRRVDRSVPAPTEAVPVDPKCRRANRTNRKVAPCPNYAAPGVYVEEVPSSQKSLTAAATAIAAFVGFTERAPTDDPSDPAGLKPRSSRAGRSFEQLYGSFKKGCMLPLSVYGYFQNGGSIAYIVRIPNTEPAGEPATLAPAADRALGSPISVSSVEPDAALSIAVSPVDSGDTESTVPPRSTSSFSTATTSRSSRSRTSPSPR